MWKEQGVEYVAYHWAWAEYIQSAAILLISRYLLILLFDKSQTKRKTTTARKTMTDTTAAIRSRVLVQSRDAAIEGRWKSAYMPEIESQSRRIMLERGAASRDS